MSITDMKYSLQLTDPDQLQYMLCFSNKEEKNEWMSALTNILTKRYIHTSSNLFLCLHV